MQFDTTIKEKLEANADSGYQQAADDAEEGMWISWIIWYNILQVYGGRENK